jgi:hypothetical protein
VNRPMRSTAGLIGLALLLGGVAAGCARHGGSTLEPVQATPTPIAAGADATATSEITVAVVPTLSPRDSPIATATPGARATPGATQPAPTTNPKPTADPLDAELQTLDQLLNGIDTSLSSSDSSETGGE